MTNERDYIIRRAEYNDLSRLTEIYNQAIDTNCCTCDTEPFTVEKRESWFINRNDRTPIFIFEINSDIVGYSYISPYRAGRQALEGVGEISYYIDFGYHRKGIGRKLVNHTIQEAKNLNYSHLLAILLECNVGSIALLEKLSFVRWGALPKVAKLNDGYFSHLYYGITL